MRSACCCSSSTKVCVDSSIPIIFGRRGPKGPLVEWNCVCGIGKGQSSAAFITTRLLVVLKIGGQDRGGYCMGRLSLQTLP